MDLEMDAPKIRRWRSGHTQAMELEVGTYPGYAAAEMGTYPIYAAGDGDIPDIRRWRWGHTHHYVDDRGQPGRRRIGATTEQLIDD